MAVAAGSDTFSVSYSRDGGTVVVHLTGDVDVYTAPAVREALAGVIDDQGNRSVRVDLDQTTFIDSTGLSVLVGALEGVRQKGGELTLANPRASIRRVFQIVGFPRIFDISA